MSEGYSGEGRCSGEMCWYTLPLVDGLIVAHSKAGTLDDCEGAGCAPLAAASDPRFRDKLAEALRDEAHRCDGDCASCRGLSDDEVDATIWATAMHDHRATQVEASPEAIAHALLPLIAAEVHAQVQAAANQRAAEANDVAVEDVRAIAVALDLGDHARSYSAHEVVEREILPALRLRAAALAQPAQAGDAS